MPFCHLCRLFVFGVLWAAVSVGGAAAQTVLDIETVPAGALVWVDGLLVGEGPVRAPVAPGRHALEARHSGYHPLLESVTVGEGDTLRVVLELDGVAGQVRFEGLPSGAAVFVEGEPVDPDDAEVLEGQHEVRVELADGRVLTTRLSVEEGRVTPVRYQPRVFAPGPLVQNVILPGTAQVVGGRRTVGIAYGAGVGLGIGAAVLGTMIERGARGRMDGALAAYEGAENEAEAVAAWEGVVAEHGDVVLGERLRAGGLATGLALYSVSLLDAFLIHARRSALEAGAPGVAWQVGPSAEGLAVRLRF